MKTLNNDLCSNKILYTVSWEFKVYESSWIACQLVKKRDPSRNLNCIRRKRDFEYKKLWSDFLYAWSIQKARIETDRILHADRKSCRIDETPFPVWKDRWNVNDNLLRVEKLRGYSRDYANPRAISGTSRGFRIVDASSREATCRHSRRISAEVRANWCGGRGVARRRFFEKNFVEKLATRKGKRKLERDQSSRNSEGVCKSSFINIVGGFSWQRVVFCEKRVRNSSTILKMDITPYLELIDYIFIRVVTRKFSSKFHQDSLTLPENL